MSKRMYIVGIVLIAGFFALMAAQMQKSVTPYMTTVAQVEQSGGRSIQFKGAIDHKSVGYDKKTHTLRFSLRDDAGSMLEVSYDGPKPGNFDTADVAVVRGVYADSGLRASQLLLKCPSKYEGKK